MNNSERKKALEENESIIEKRLGHMMIGTEEGILKTPITCPTCGKEIIKQCFLEDDCSTLMSCPYCSYDEVNGVEWHKSVVDCPSCGENEALLQVNVENGEYDLSCMECKYGEDHYTHGYKDVEKIKKVKTNIKARV